MSSGDIFARFAKRSSPLAASRPLRGSPPLGGSAIGGGDGDSVSGITAESGKSSKVIKDSFSVVVIDNDLTGFLTFYGESNVPIFSLQ